MNEAQKRKWKDFADRLNKGTQLAAQSATPHGVAAFKPQALSQSKQAKQANAAAAERERLEEEKEEQQMYLVDLVESCLNAYRQDEQLVSASFYILSTNVLLRTDDRVPKWPPLEIGIIEFGIKDGIKQAWHSFVDPGEIPNGDNRLNYKILSSILPDNLFSIFLYLEFHSFLASTFIFSSIFNHFNQQSFFFMLHLFFFILFYSIFFYASYLHLHLLYHTFILRVIFSSKFYQFSHYFLLMFLSD